MRNLSGNHDTAHAVSPISWSTTEAILERVVATLHPMHGEARPPGPSATSSADSSIERRRYPREPMALRVEVFGYDRDLALVHAYGTTDNVSRQGLFARVDSGLPVGSRAVISVRHGPADVGSRILRGRVVRCETDDGSYGLALRLDHDVVEWQAPQVAADPRLAYL